MTNDNRPNAGGEPMFNLPPVIVGWLGLLMAIHVSRLVLLSPESDVSLIYTLGFVPFRYDLIGGEAGYPGDPYAAYWSPVTYSLLHGGWTHLIFNSFWLAAFGTVLARRLGAIRFIAFSLAGTVVAALGFFIADPHSQGVVIGASGAISAHVGAASRFMFQRRSRAGNEPRALSIAGVFADPRAFGFVAIWMVTNILFGTVVTIGAEGGSIAWEAHLGGFLFGLFALHLFDRPVD